MNKKLLAFALLGLLILMTVPTISAAQPPILSDELIIDTIGEIETVDPAWSYDTASAELIMNIYEPLLFFDVDWDSPELIGQAPGPYSAGKIDAFVPYIASAMPTIVHHDPPLTGPQGQPVYSTWTFPINTAIKFHSGNTVTAADVEYSFERAMVQDRSGGPTWMLWEPLMACYFASPPSGFPVNPDDDDDIYDFFGPADDAFGAKLDYAVEDVGNTVVFHLSSPYPELAFTQIISQAWGSIMERAWAVAEGDLPGNWASQSWYDIWDPEHDLLPVYGDVTQDGWHDPAVSYLEDSIEHTAKDAGTGPYMLDYYSGGTGYSVIRFADYWQGWAAPISGNPGNRLPDYVSRITWYIFDDWTVRRGRFLAGDSDLTVVPRNYRDQILGQTAPDGELIRCLFRTKASGKGVTGLSASEFHMTVQLSDGTYAYNVKPDGTFGSDGIPLNIFSDVNVRKGFAYALDYNWFISTVQLNEGEQAADPIVKGLAYDNPLQQKYNFDLSKAEYYLKLAWGGVDTNPGDGENPATVTPGALWNGGMKMDVTYNTGNVARELASQNLATNINGLNPGLFNLQLRGLVWGTTYLPAMVAQQLPVFHIGWLADYADPHDFAFPYFHSAGTFAYSQAYGNGVVDAVIEAGILTPDDVGDYHVLDAANGLTNLDNKPAGDWHTWSTDPTYYLDNPLDNDFPRAAIYYAIQEMWYEESIAPMYYQGLVRHFEQPWVHGWYYNSLYPGIYGYHIWKAQTHFGDVDNDGTVGILDWSTLSASWTGPPKGIKYFLPQADLTGGIGGSTGGNEGGVKGLPNGAVEIDDLSLVSAYWD